MSWTLSSGPANKASTDPSRLLRTQPSKPRRIASRSVQPRNQTPCTCPVIRTRTATVVIARYASFELQDCMIDREAGPGGRMDFLDPAVAFAAKRVLHLPRFSAPQSPPRL